MRFGDPGRLVQIVRLQEQKRRHRPRIRPGRRVLRPAQGAFRGENTGLQLMTCTVDASRPHTRLLSSALLISIGKAAGALSKENNEVLHGVRVSPAGRLGL